MKRPASLLLLLVLALLLPAAPRTAQADEADAPVPLEALRRIPTDSKGLAAASKALTPRYRAVAAPIYEAAFGRESRASGFAARGTKADGTPHWSFGEYWVGGDWVQTETISRRKALVVSIRIAYEAGAATKRKMWSQATKVYRGQSVTKIRFHGDRAAHTVAADGHVQEIDWQWGDHFIHVSMADPYEVPDVRAVADRVHAAAMKSGYYAFPRSLFGEPKPREREPQEPGSRYAEMLWKQSDRTQAVAAELMEMIRQGEDDPATIDRVGRRLVDEFDRAVAVMDTYRKARKRFGLHTEYTAYRAMLEAFRLGQHALGQLTDEAPPVVHARHELEAAHSLLRDDLLPMVKKLVDMELGAQGAADLLTDFGFQKLAGTVTNHVASEIDYAIAEEIKAIVGTRLHVGLSLKDHLLAGARTWIGKKVGNILLRMAAGHLVVEILGRKILEWAGPKLRELLRPKGKLRSRVERARAGMRRRQITLDGLRSASDMAKVRHTVEAALKHLRANKHLRGDLRRADEVLLTARLTEGETRLLRAIKRAKRRFHMDSPFARQEFGEAIDALRAARARTAQALDRFAGA